jgi:hypothetical protein
MGVLFQNLAAGLKKTMKFLRIAGDPAEIRPRHFANTSLEPYRYNNPFISGFVVDYVNQ